jgi:hypothetical protein
MAYQSLKFPINSAWSRTRQVRLVCSILLQESPISRIVPLNQSDQPSSNNPFALKHYLLQTMFMVFRVSSVIWWSWFSIQATKYAWDF